MTFDHLISVESSHHLFPEGLPRNRKCKKGYGGYYSETSFEDDYVINRNIWTSKVISLWIKKKWQLLWNLAGSCKTNNMIQKSHYLVFTQMSQNMSTQKLTPR